MSAHVDQLRGLPLFPGPDVTERDERRLTGQIERIFALMRDGQWRTLREIAAETGDGEASISAQLRHLTREKHGGHTKDRRRRGESGGLWEYKIIPNRTLEVA